MNIDFSFVESLEPILILEMDKPWPLHQLLSK
jgi:hypothetical protein